MSGGCISARINGMKSLIEEEEPADVSIGGVMSGRHVMWRGGVIGGESGRWRRKTSLWATLKEYHQYSHQLSWRHQAA
jgi:hypothetical protein